MHWALFCFMYFQDKLIFRFKKKKKGGTAFIFMNWITMHDRVAIRELLFAYYNHIVIKFLFNYELPNFHVCSLRSPFSLLLEFPSNIVFCLNIKINFFFFVTLRPVILYNYDKCWHFNNSSISPLLRF